MAKKRRRMWTPFRRRALAAVRSAGITPKVMREYPERVEAVLVQFGYSPRTAITLSDFFADRSETALRAQFSLSGATDKQRGEAIQNGMREQEMNDQQHRFWIAWVIERAGLLPVSEITRRWNEQYAGMDGYPAVTASKVEFWLNKTRNMASRKEAHAMPHVSKRVSEHVKTLAEETIAASDRKYQEEIVEQTARAAAAVKANSKVPTHLCIECEVELPFTSEYFSGKLNPKVLRCTICARMHKRRSSRQKSAGSPSTAGSPYTLELREQIEQVRTGKIAKLLEEREQWVRKKRRQQGCICSNCELEWPDDKEHIPHKPKKAEYANQNGPLCIVCHLERQALYREIAKLKKAGKWNRQTALELRRRHAKLFRLTPRRKCKSCRSYWAMSGLFWQRPTVDQDCVFCS